MTDRAKLSAIPLAAVPLSAVDAGTAAAAFNAAYENYVVPVSFTAEALQQRMRADSVDPASSTVYLDGDRPVGLLLVARRGRTSRIAAIGFAPALRGSGLGRRALEAAVSQAGERRDDRILLEVITSNAPAVALYRKLGFVVRRDLAGYRSPEGASPQDASLAEIDPDDARSMLAALSDDDLPWQLQPASFTAAAPTVKGLSLAGEAVALVDETAAGPRLLTLAVDPAGRGRGLARRLLRAIAGRYPAGGISIVAVVPERTGTPVFASAGWTRTEIGQHEMEHRLRPPATG